VGDEVRAGRTWRRWAAEVAAIVGSILLAFAIDAWWDDVQMRQDARAALEQLRGEFLSNSDVIHEAQSSHEEAQRMFVEMVRIIRHSGDPAGSYVVPDSILFALGSWTTVDPAQGVLDALVNSGRILLIDDSNLRADLTSWAKALEDVREEEIEDRRITSDQVLPLIGRYVPLVSMEYRMGGDPTFPAPSAFEGDYRGLLGSLVFENAMHGRLVRKLNILDEYAALLARHRSILDRIENRLKAAS
jgi:hypothetical protein